MATLQMYMDQSKIDNTFASENSVGKIKKILMHCPGDTLFLCLINKLQS